MGVVEVTGTISSVYTPEMDAIGGKFLQKVIIDNASMMNGIESVESRILLTLKINDYYDVIPFKVNDPITVKGMYKQEPSGFISVIHSAHAPLGFIRYNGRVYR